MIHNKVGSDFNCVHYKYNMLDVSNYCVVPVVSSNIIAAPTKSLF